MPKKVWYAPNKFESYGEEEIKAVEACLRDGCSLVLVIALWNLRKELLKHSERDMDYL